MNGNLTEMCRHNGRTRIYALEPMAQRIYFFSTHKIGFGQEYPICKTHLTPHLLSAVELLLRMLRIHQRND
ncbi:hypothetical protein IP95_02315 [Extensimonas vulgaris]|uniref:Uncharacterized protein n=1 Tax=Extensimonas vulgaris TaxID=1031594 RepID=A0A369ANV5_9BURK|nr:hypothetical protein DFR45_1032 [Extensimonas vulgaris]TWI36585.1 hypothetical protein IP95_02315 [Extensimonas vulgaris]